MLIEGPNFFSDWMIYSLDCTNFGKASDLYDMLREWEPLWLRCEHYDYPLSEICLDYRLLDTDDGGTFQ